jgi:hypothetical protein
MDTNYNGKGTPERPKHRWLNNIKMNHKERGSKDMNCIHMDKRAQ